MSYSRVPEPKLRFVSKGDRISISFTDGGSFGGNAHMDGIAVTTPDANYFLMPDSYLKLLDESPALRKLVVRRLKALNRGKQPARKRVNGT